MAYMSQSASPRSSNYSNKASPRKTAPQDGPIKEFMQVIEASRPEQWQKRTGALHDLVSQIPTGQEYARREAWYNSPPTLRHLHQPIGELLKDPRSTVVKRTCESLGQLFARCQGDAKYLFKDLMPVVLNVHAQTVQVIRSQVEAMVLEAIPVVPCKMAMPLWLDRLKTDKSRTVREACVLYLSMGIKHWTIDDTESGSPYLTEENWVQIGTAFIKTLRDPSPTVRNLSKQGITTIRESQPDLWDQLIRDPDGPAGKDIKLQKWLIKVSEEGDPNTNDGELSVASRFSLRSSVSKAVPSTPTNRNSTGSGLVRPTSRGSTSNSSNNHVPMSINVGSKQDKAPQPQGPPRVSRSGLGPPMRRPFAQAVDQNIPSPTNYANQGGYQIPQLGTPPRPPVAPSPNRRPLTQRSPSPSPRRPERHQPPMRSRSTSSASIPSTKSEPTVDVEDGSVMSHNVPRGRARPTPEAMNGENHFANVSNNGSNNLHLDPSQVIDLVDQASPLHLQPDPPQEIIPEQEFSSGVYSHASSTEMLDVTKRIDQTLAHVEQPNLSPPPQQQQLQPQQHQPLSPSAGSVAPDPEPHEEGPFIASMNELKEHASRRRSRRSIHMKERWSRGESIGGFGSPTPLATTVQATPADAVSSLGGSVYNHAEDNVKPLPPTPALPEHYIIAEQLLRVHKTHVDQIMETLKIEMDTLRDFEQSLEMEKAPSPDQVLDYFESVGLCLDQRTSAGNILQREMDRISKGAFTTNNRSNGGR